MKRIQTFLSIKQLLAQKPSPHTPHRQDALEQLILEHPDITDEVACYALYGNTQKGSSYRNVKHKLEQRLTGEMLLLAADTSHKRRYNYRMLYALSQVTIGLLLLKYFRRTVAIKYLERGYAFARANDLLEVAILAQQALQNHYGYVNIHKGRMEALITEGYALVDLLRVEKRVKEYNTRLSHLHTTKAGPYTDAEMQQILEAKNDLEQIVRQYRSRTIHFLGYDLIYYYYDVINDYARCWEVAEEGLEIMQRHYPEDVKFEYRMQLNLAMAAFHMGQYNKSIEFYKSTLAVLTKGSRAWFRDTAVLFTMMIRAGAYGQLFDLYKSVVKHKSLKEFPLELETWQIRAAYLHFLIAVGKVEAPDQMPRFRVYRFVNSFELKDKDKRGANVSIQVIKILFLLLYQKYDRVIDIAEGLEQYTYRYLRKDETFRSNCFIKMLLQAVKASFHPLRTRRYTEKLHQRLLGSEIHLEDRGDYAELIPFDELWSDFLLCLDTNHS